MASRASSRTLTRNETIVMLPPLERPTIDALGNDLEINLNGKRHRLDPSTTDPEDVESDRDDTEDQDDDRPNQEHLLRRIEEQQDSARLNPGRSKPILQISMDSDIVTNSFRSMRSAQRFGYNLWDISKCCQGKQYSHANFRWRYRNEAEHCIWAAEWDERKEEHERLKRQCMEERYGIIPILLFEMDDKEMAKEGLMSLD